MKKKLHMVIIGLFLILLSVNGTAFAENNISVKLNGETLLFDVQPQIINGRTMVPMRTIFERLGATVNWDQPTQTITSVKGETTISLIVNIPFMIVNGKEKKLDAAPCVVNNRTLVPVRAISEAFYMNVDWDNDTQTVLITPPNVNITAYNGLKSAIIRYGRKSSVSNRYDIFYSASSNFFSVLIGYDATFDSISLYLSGGDNMEYSTMILLYKDRNPDLIFSCTMTDDSKYKINAHFPYSSKPFIEESNTFPQSLLEESYKILNIQLELLDMITQDYTGISLSDLGMYYEVEQ